MAFNLARSTRWFTIAAMLGLSTTVAGCGAAPDAIDQDEEDTVGASTSAITDVDQSTVKRQSIGNCWLYAAGSWAESLNKSATNQELNLSESYWTYWHWFDQIANGGASTKISTGGSFGVAAEIINRYGNMTEADFIPTEATAEMSARQASAEAAINESFKSGALKTAAARRNRGTIRRELDRVWGLSPTVVANMNRVFGPSVTRTLDRSAVTTGTTVKKAKELPISVYDARTDKTVTATLQDAIGTRSGFSGRSGPLAWNQFSYPQGAAARRDFQERFQKALHHKVPVVISWFVDFNAMSPGGKFLAPPATPGHQGGHLVVMEDYQVNDVPGFGTLPAGVLETRPAALKAALDDSAKVEFIRIKNSWGNFRPDRNFTSGYHDLYMAYLNGPVQRCETDDNDDPIEGTCFGTTPLQGIVLPPGL